MPETVDQILLRFPGPVTLYPSRKKWIKLVLISLCFVAGGIFLLRIEADAFARFIAWACIIFFGAGIPLGLVMMLPGVSHLRLNKQDFEAKHLFRSWQITWQDATEFQSWIPSIPRASKSSAMVVFDEAKEKGNLALLNRSLAGRTSALPDTYGLSADDLARLMNAWRQRAVR